MRSIIKTAHFILLSISVGFFMAVVYNAVQGKALELSAFSLWGFEPGALIVAVVLTGTWIVEGLALRFRLPEGRYDWFVTAAVLAIALIVDCGITLAFILGIAIPERLPLFVTIAHATTQALRWVIASYQRESHDDGILKVGYEPLEARYAVVSAELKLLKDGMAIPQLQAPQLYRTSCLICHRTFESSSEVDANNKLASHIRRAHPDGKAKATALDMSEAKSHIDWKVE